MRINFWLGAPALPCGVEMRQKRAFLQGVIVADGTVCLWAYPSSRFTWVWLLSPKPRAEYRCPPEQGTWVQHSLLLFPMDRDLLLKGLIPQQKYVLPWSLKKKQRIKRKSELDPSSESQAVPRIWTTGIYGFWVKDSTINETQLFFIFLLNSVHSLDYLFHPLFSVYFFSSLCLFVILVYS